MQDSALPTTGRGPGWLDEIAESSLALECPTREQALAVLRSSDDELIDVVAAAARVRRGGSWHGGPRYSRSADRIALGPAGWLNRLGFRVARVQSGR